MNQDHTTNLDISVCSNLKEVHTDKKEIIKIKNKKFSTFTSPNLIAENLEIYLTILFKPVKTFFQFLYLFGVFVYRLAEISVDTMNYKKHIDKRYYNSYQTNSFGYDINCFCGHNTTILSFIFTPYKMY